MSQFTTDPSRPAPTATSTAATTEISPPTSPTNAPQTRRLLAAGMLAGPLFLGAWALQAWARDGFDPTRHPVSLLSLGDAGWVQILTFVLTGVLIIAGAVGMRSGLRGGPGARWAPRLVGAFGAALVLAGVFVTDPGAGFPAGAPAGAPALSWHGGLHQLSHLLALGTWTAACFVLRRRFVVLGPRGLARGCLTAVVATFVVLAWPDLDSLSIRLMIASAVQFGLIAVVAIHLRRVVPVPPRTVPPRTVPPRQHG